MDLLLSNFKDYKRIGGGFGIKHVQEMRFFEEKFLPLFIAETDTFKQCILAHCFMVSVYEFIGFKFIGKIF